MKPQVHIDNETLDTTHTAQLLSIGACCGDERFYVEIDQSGYSDKPFTQSKSTLEWWAKQGGFKQTQALESPMNAVHDLFNWIIATAPTDFEVWANSPSFDLAQLRYHAEQFMLPVPWAFYQEQDVRTLKRTAQHLNLRTPTFKNPHHALQDALNQHKFVTAVQQELVTAVERARRVTRFDPILSETIDEEIRLELLSTERFRDLPEAIFSRADKEGHSRAAVSSDAGRESAAQDAGITG